MSQVRSDVDLSALARPEPSVEPPRRSKLRVLVPLVLLLGFAGVLASTLTDLFRPTREVTVVRPTTPTADQLETLGEGTVVVQASGWVEPDPFPVHVPALANGVVEELLVQESDEVEAGQVVARMIDDDARIASDSAKAELAIREAELAQARARRDIARERLEAALEVTEALDTARARHDGAREAAARRAAAVAEGEARLALAEDELVVQRELEEAGTSGVRQVELAQGAADEARGRLEGLRAEAALAEAEVRAARARLTRAEGDHELRFDDRLEAELAEAQMDHAQAEVRRAVAVLEEAELRLSRMEIRSPVDGVVLERLTNPGTVLSVQVEGQAVCSLYDPDSLRIRVDVPQPDVERLFVGQRAEIDAESRRGRPYAGEVLRVVQKADISKVTLEAHVRVLDPDGLLKPDMLAQVRFLGRPSREGEEEVEADRVVLIPRRVVEDGHVWVVGSGDEAERRRVELGPEHGDRVEVRSGLDLTAKVIDGGRNALEPGDRVEVSGGKE